MGDRGKAGDLLVVDGDGRKLVASLDQSDGCSCLPPSSWGRWFPPTHPTNDSTTHQLLRLAAATEDRIGAMECASTKYGTPKFYNEQGGEAAPGLHGGASTGKFAAVKEQKKMLATGKSGRRHAKRHSAAASSCDKDHDFFRYPGERLLYMSHAPRLDRDQTE